MKRLGSRTRPLGMDLSVSQHGLAELRDGERTSADLEGGMTCGQYSICLSMERCESRGKARSL